MHELSVCQALMEQIEQIAMAQHATRIHAIHLDIGPLSGVETGLLEQAFPIASAGSRAAGARLVVNPLPVVVNCRSCGSQSEVVPARLVCGQCGDWQTELVSGDEMLLTSVELDKSSE